MAEMGYGLYHPGRWIHEGCHYPSLEGVGDGMVGNVGRRKEVVKAVIWDVIASPMVPLILEIEFMTLCVRFL